MKHILTTLLFAGLAGVGTVGCRSTGPDRDDEPTPSGIRITVDPYCIRSIRGISELKRETYFGLCDHGTDFDRRCQSPQRCAELVKENGITFGRALGVVHELGFQGKWSHYEESLRTPLVIYDPRLPKARRDRVVEQMLLSVDLPATFLDWAGVKQPAGYEDRSLAPNVQGESRADWHTHFFCEHVDLAPTLTWEDIRGERFVYARYFDQKSAFEFLHDLKADPDELTNLATDPSHAVALKELRSLCDKEINARGGPLLSVEERASRKDNARKAAQKSAANNGEQKQRRKRGNP